MNRRLLPPVVGVVGFVATWEAFVRVFHVKRFILDAPSRAITFLVQHWGLYQRNAITTVGHASLGISISLLVGLLIGAVLAASAFLERAAEPVLMMVQVAPWFAYFFSIVLWLHAGDRPVIFLVALACFPAFTFAAVDGMRSADHAARELLASVSASRIEVLWRLRLPSALPFIFNALRFNLGLALAASYYGETASRGNAGLGWLGNGYSVGQKAAGLWATVLMMVIVGSAGLILLSLARRRLLHWHPSQRLQRG
jgi:NitT/TauT family transport system permease protein